MLPVLSLRTKIISLFTGMAAIVVVAGIALLWYTYRVDTMLGTMVKKELVIYRAAQDMELALANQKGYVTYYLVDGEAKWLEALGQYRQVFAQNLTQTAALDLNVSQRQALEDIARRYAGYIEAKDVAIANYRANSSTGTISSLHEKQREVFFELLTRCRDFSQRQWLVIQHAEELSQRRSEKLRMIAYGAILVFTALGGLLLFMLYRQILVPIRDLALEAGSSPQESSRDEVVSLSHSVKDMKRNFDQTHEELARSRKHLVQVERMAMVGELAAGVAHTIRNPFTSIKMRMFSLTRSLELSRCRMKISLSSPTKSAG